MNRSKSSLTTSNGVRTCTSASPQCGRSSRTSRAQNANTRCVGALSHARVAEVVYGAPEPRMGSLVSTLQGLESVGLHHRFEVTGGVLEAECRELIQEFFRARR